MPQPYTTSFMAAPKACIVTRKISFPYIESGGFGLETTRKKTRIGGRVQHQPKRWCGTLNFH
jgi:hypothetical protein